MKGNETDPATPRPGREYDLRAPCQLAALKPTGDWAQKARLTKGTESWPVHGQGSGPAGEDPQPPAQTHRAYHPTRTKMTRHISPHNQTIVPVLDQHGAPLAPTRPSRARRWIESGKAIGCWKHGRFAVQILNRSLGPPRHPGDDTGNRPRRPADRHGSDRPEPGGLTTAHELVSFSMRW